MKQLMVALNTADQQLSWKRQNSVICKDIMTKEVENRRYINTIINYVIVGFIS